LADIKREQDISDIMKLRALIQKERDRKLIEKIKDLFSPKNINKNNRYRHSCLDFRKII
jgi:hypothetical protein